MDKLLIKLIILQESLILDVIIFLNLQKCMVTTLAVKDYV